MGIHSGSVRPLTRMTIPPPLNITTPCKKRELFCQDLEEDWIKETDDAGTVESRSLRFRENRSCGSLPEPWCRHGSHPNQERYFNGRKKRKGKKTRNMIDEGVAIFNLMQEDGEDNRRANYADRYEGY
jgi:hypothetical protein